MIARLTIAALALFSLVSLILAYAPIATELPIAAGLHFILWWVVILGTRNTINASNGSFADATVSTFLILFALIAPSIQLQLNPYMLVNTLTPAPDAIESANIQFILFSATYYYLRRNINQQDTSASERASEPGNYSMHAIAVVLLLSFAAFAITAKISIEFLQARTIEESDLQITPSILIKTKVIGFICIPLLLYLIQLKERTVANKWLLLGAIAFATLGVVFSQNPLLEKRQSLGPVYLTIAAMVFGLQRIKTGLQRFLFIFVPTVIFMPLLAMFTHVNSANWEDLAWSIDLIGDHFTEIHYDAWANTVAAAEMVQHSGLYWGKQLTGSVLFWLPRDFWPDKPLMTGAEIAQYLETNYSMWFLNLSAPLPAEGYLDFWYFGSAIYGYILARISRHLDSLAGGIAGKPYVGAGVFFSFFLMFLLRGAMMNAVAYGTGNLISFAAIAVVFRSTRHKWNGS